MRTYTVKDKTGSVVGTVELKPRGNMKMAWFRHVDAQLRKSRLLPTVPFETVSSYTQAGDYADYVRVALTGEHGEHLITNTDFLIELVK